MDSITAEKMILYSIKHSNGIRPRELERRYVKNKDGSENVISIAMLRRTIKRLVEEKKIEREETPGKKEVRYYLAGHRRSLPLGKKRSDFDSFVVDECKHMLAYILDTDLLILNARDEGFTTRDDAFHTTIDGDSLIGLNVRLAVIYRLVSSWEQMRDYQIVRTWDEEFDESLLDFGPEFFIPENAHITGTDKYPDIMHWYQFLITVIDTISNYS